MRNKENQKIKTALIGYGYWGKILASKFINHPHFELKYICDPKLDLDETHFKNQAIHFIQDQSTILNDAEIQAVLIAVPPIFHFQVAKACLLSKKHVWLEKPACTSLEDFEVLRRLSTENQRILHVDYLYLFNPLIHQIKELIQSSEIISFHAVRMNQNHIGASSGFHEQIDLIYDLGVHDLSIFSFLVPQVKRFQFKHQIDSKNHVLILFGRLDQIDVRIELSWKHTHKVRQLLITLLNGIIIEFTLDDQGCEVLNVFEIGGIEQIQYQQQFDSLKQSLLHFYLNISKMDDDQTLLDVASDVHKAIQIGFRLNM